MTTEQFLDQTNLLEEQIKFDLDQIKTWRELSVSVRSIAFDDHGHNPNAPDQASFVNLLELIDEREEKIKNELAELIRLKDEITAAIETVPNKEKQLVLKYRYIDHMSWRRIARRMHADDRTVRRWHDEAIPMVKVPENP